MPRFYIYLSIPSFLWATAVIVLVFGGCVSSNSVRPVCVKCMYVCGIYACFFIYLFLSSLAYTSYVFQGGRGESQARLVHVWC
ncbi:hypothetical protein F4775DRAFT_546906 [Biscogniauxia sp. FL1348]|nr:hypothetical protein F4775DRAFT_546906 [Biscogniauxia sp. FL1348]